VRYLTVVEALVIAEAVTGLNVATLARSPRLNLLDSALNAPQASFGEQEKYPDVIDKAAVLAVRIARNHPLIDGNKRLSWGCLTMFLILNELHLEATADDAVTTMVAVAAGEIDEEGLAEWLSARVKPVTAV
jgi:death-on-curing protein